MGADVQHTLGRLPPEEPGCPLSDILARYALFALGPYPDALKQSTGFVPTRFAGGQGRVQVNVRLDKRRCEKPSSGLDLAFGLLLDLPCDLFDPALGYLNVNHIFAQMGTA